MEQDQQDQQGRILGIGRYRITRLIGSAGFGMVYLAWDPVLDREVALKVLRPEIPEQRKAIHREAKAAAKLNHPNIVTIYDVGEDKELSFIAMEYVDGETLAQIIRDQRPLSLDTRLFLITDLCSGIAYAHSAGLIHRDIKPANLMVRRDGRLKILDFGIARRIAATTLPQFAGTPQYMSPEQIRAEEDIDQRSDVFAIGAVMYELFSGRRAFPGGSPEAALYQILHSDPPPLAVVAPSLDPGFARIVECAMQKDRVQRYASVDELLRDLQKLHARMRRIWEAMPKAQPVAATLADAATPGHAAAKSPDAAGSAPFDAARRGQASKPPAPLEPPTASSTPPPPAGAPAKPAPAELQSWSRMLTLAAMGLTLLIGATVVRQCVFPASRDPLQAQTNAPATQRLALSTGMTEFLTTWKLVDVALIPGTESVALAFAAPPPENVGGRVVTASLRDLTQRPQLLIAGLAHNMRIGPTGDRMITQELQGPPDMWSIPDGVRLGPIGSRGSLDRISFSADGRTIAVPAVDGDAIDVLNGRTGGFLRSLPVQANVRAARLAVRPDGAQIAVVAALTPGGQRSPDIIIDAVSGATVHVFLDSHSAEATWHPDGRLALVPGGWTKVVDIMDTKSWTVSSVMTLYGTSIVSPDGKWIAEVSPDRVVVTDTHRNGPEHKPLEEGDGLNTYCAFSSNSALLLVGNQKHLAVYETTHWQKITSVP